MQHVDDLNGGNGCALQRRQQHAPERITQRQAETALKRFGYDARDPVLFVAGIDLQFLRFNQFLPVFLEHVLPHRFPDRRQMPLPHSSDGQKNSLRSRYTRRRLGARQPLCGMGVTSRIAVTFRPTVCSARSADSRPAPGPLTSTSSVRMPCSTAFFAASSAVTCAAYGVDLREPLKPSDPAADHDTALPLPSVIVTIVLWK